ncbi:site-2 protease family protein [Halorussus amylolyticus]|uniref:site-2 protease family protein n=1 Tax=Halorussus amylolyticus TaxID=1126242 RepID=UPI00138EDD62|nr:site-2 protease family protein [Halorussus amylolyticus]
MRNYTIGSVWGIPIRINISLLVFLPVLAWLLGSGEQIDVYTGVVNGFTPTALDPAVLNAGNAPWLIGAGAAVGLFASVGVHELGHAWAARRYGIETDSITLWILGGLASLREMPREWHKEFWIAIAGPAASVLVAAACYAVVAVLPSSVPVVTFVFGWLVVTNLVLTVFNLLPAFPMDGGRILRALLSRSRPYASATQTAARIGSLFALGFAVVGVLSFSPMLLLLAVFVYGAANGESRHVALATLLEGVTAGDVVTGAFDPVAADASVETLLDRMMTERRTEFPVVDDDGTVVGVVSIADVRRVKNRDSAETTVGEILREGASRVSADTDAFEVLGLLNTGKTAIVVVEDAGEPIGVLTRTDFTAALDIRRAGGGPVSPRTAM